MTCRRRLGHWAGFAFIMMATASCAYRFTNKHVAIPAGIRSLAIENIYDTSGEVIPHHILWESLQRAFARDGHLRVASQGSADALLRAHITKANVRPIGSSFETKPETDKNPDQFPPSSYKDFRTLPQAGEFTRKEQISYTVNVEIIELYSQRILFSKSYEGTRQFRTARSESQFAEIKTHFLMYEEALRAKFAQISDNIAENVVRDFIVGR